MKDATTQLNEVDSLINIYEETVAGFEERLQEKMETLHITDDFIHMLSLKDDDEIEQMTLADIKMWLTQTGCNQDCIQDAYYSLPDTEKMSSFSEFAIKFLLDLRNEYMSLQDSKKSIKDLHESRADITKAYYAALRSPEYRQARLAHLAALKENLKNEPDEIKRAELARKLSQIEASQTFSFLNERLRRYGKKEMKSIMNCFFEKARSEYTLEVYYNKLKRLNLNKFTHMGFFNLEEKYMPENFEPFNNFFLFHVIRWVSHIDTTNDADNLYFAAIIGGLRDLVTGEATEDEKETLLFVMKEFYSFLDMDKYDAYFREKNSNYKHHEVRIAFEEAERIRKHQLIEDSLKKELGSLYNESADYGDIEAYYQKLMNEKHDLYEKICELSEKQEAILKRTGLENVTYEDLQNIYDDTVEKIKEREGEAIIDESGTETESDSSGDEVISSGEAEESAE